MTAKASLTRRILAAAAALLMLQWTALAFGAGGVPVGMGGVDRLAPAGHAEPMLLPEWGAPLAAKEPPGQDREPPAEGAAIVPARPANGSAKPRPFVAAFGEAVPTASFVRAFDARAPPSSA